MTAAKEQLQCEAQAASSGFNWTWFYQCTLPAKICTTRAFGWHEFFDHDDDLGRITLCFTHYRLVAKEKAVSRYRTRKP